MGGPKTTAVTVREILASARRLAGTPETRLEISQMLARAIGQSREWLIANDDRAIDEEARRRFDAMLERRCCGEPLAYILGSAGFYGREFEVNSHVLVPRPETEHLIDDLRASVDAAGATTHLDVGTGSGAIAVTIAAELKNARVDAVDISNEALEVARRNARANGVEDRIAFFQGDLVEPVRERHYESIVANLPYVPTADIAAYPDPVSYEPVLALDGGPDGLDLYRRLLANVPRMLRPGGIMYLEAAPPLMDGLVALARAAFPHGKVTVGKDYGERERFVKVELPG